MRPLPRLFAVTDAAIAHDPDFGIKAAAILSVGPAVAIVARAPEASAKERLRLTDRVRALARPAEAATIAHGDPALAEAADAQGVQLRPGDLDPRAARSVFARGWIGVSVHDLREASAAVADGADYLVAGNVYETATHPGRPARGLPWLREIVALGTPVVAIGGIGPDQVAPVLETGAWGVAAIRSLWHDGDPAKAADRMARAVNGE
jgi:thiamine-phosphate pyrophosphorylase